MSDGATRAAIEAVWRIESARLIGGARAHGARRRPRRGARAGRARHRARALAATTGIPDNPGAWLMATAKHRAHRPAAPRADAASASTSELDDDARRARRDDARPRGGARRRRRRRPAAPRARRVPPGAVDRGARRAHAAPARRARRPTRSRARSSSPEPTIAQRIVRAKRTLAEARVPFEVPRGAELAARLASVLEVIYLVFNEGYAATAGDDWMRPELCEDALRLGRILAGLVPDEPEVHGLVALMEIQASRLRARVGADGRADPAARAGPRALGSPAHAARPRRARARRGAGAAARAVRAAGGDRRLPRARAHRRARPTGRASSRSTTRSSSSRRRRSSSSTARSRSAMAFGPADGARARRRARRRAGARGVPPAAERARRSAR